MIPDESSTPSDDQLRYFKAFELLLVCISPRAHRACRYVYDRVGPALASRIRHPAAADAGYFALKPLEWAARACLALAAPGQGERARRLYRAPSAGRT